jgi:DNA-binding transcriptional ArsR family regulator
MKRDELYTRFDSVFFEKTRLSIMTILYRERTASFSHLKAVIGGSDGAIYAHLKKLWEAGYIHQKKRIRGDTAQTFYFLTRAGSRSYREYLSFLESLLTHGEEVS